MKKLLGTQTASLTVSDRIGRWGNLMKLWELLKKIPILLLKKYFKWFGTKKPVDIQNENSDQKRKTSSDFVLLSVFLWKLFIFPRKCGQ